MSMKSVRWLRKVHTSVQMGLIRYKRHWDNTLVHSKHRKINLVEIFPKTDGGKVPE